jgi:undecaprenyl-diphosphatase
MRPVVVALALVVGGIAIMVIEAGVRGRHITDAATVSISAALLIGLAQCLAMIPGTSRSAATIMGALLIGLTPAAAAEFSFFLAIPTMFAAGGYSLMKYLKGSQAQQLALMAEQGAPLPTVTDTEYWRLFLSAMSRDEWILLGIGFVTAFVVAWLVVAAFMRFIQTHKFTSFAIYRIVLGIFVLIYIYAWQ